MYLYRWDYCSHSTFVYMFLPKNEDRKHSEGSKDGAPPLFGYRFIFSAYIDDWNRTSGDDGVYGDRV